MAQAVMPAKDVENVVGLFELINERLSLQKEVALYKHIKNLPTFVPSREQQVLADVASIAKAQQLDLQSVQAFVDTQLRVSVNIQVQWRKEFNRHHPEHTDINDLEHVIRPKLSQLTNEIVEKAGKLVDIIQDPDNKTELEQLFDETIDVELITTTQREAILNALIRIKKA